jgi:hypothetical protein
MLQDQLTQSGEGRCGFNYVLDLLAGILLVHTVDENKDECGSTGNCEVNALGDVDLGERHVEIQFVAKKRRDAAAA